MKSEKQSWGRRFHHERIKFLCARDAAKVAAAYAADAVLISFRTVIVGRENLEKYFTEYLSENGGDFGDVRIDNFVETEDAVFWEATVTDAGGAAHRVYDAFAFRDGEIKRHFTGAIN